MIHKLLNLTRPLIVLDTETTGTNTNEDRIVELAFQVWTAEGLQKEYRTLVNPGVPIPASATEVHGIKDSAFTACRECAYFKDVHPVAESDVTMRPCAEFKSWPTFKQLAPNLAIGFKDCDYAGKNVRFDLRILSAEMKRASVEWSYAGARIVDADRLEALLNPRSLSHLYRKYSGGKLDGAHGALTDVKASTFVIEEQMKETIQNIDEIQTLPSDLDQLHQLQWPGWIDTEGTFVRVNGVSCFGRWGKHAGKRMDHPDLMVAIRGETYYDFILKGNFNAEVKKIAANAKMGVFP